MIYVLETVNNMSDFCSNFMLYNVLKVARRVIDLIQIAGPIIAIVALTISVIMLVINPDNIEVYKPRIKNSIIATVVLFLIPTLINVVMQLPGIEENTTIGECWAAVDNQSKKK